MRTACLGFLLALLGLPHAAQARDPTCPELFNYQFEATLDEVEKSFRNSAFGRARSILDAAEPRVPCLVEIVPTEVLARFARQRAIIAALDVDLDDATRWARLARTLDSETPWPDLIPPTHPAWQVLSEAEATDPTRIPNRGLRIEDGGGVFLDGRLLTLPESELQMPHLLQVGDAYGRLTVSQWQDGLAFPPDVLGPPVEMDDVMPAWFGKPPGSIKGPRPVRARRFEAAGALALAAGTLYGGAWLARSAYQDRPTDGLRTAVNGTTVASAATGVLAAGTFTLALTTQR